MRLLMLNNEFPPLGGGTGTVNKAILQRFSDVASLEIDLITSGLGRCREEERFADRIRISKVPVENRNIHHSSGRELLTYAIRALREARARHRAQPYDLCFAWSGVPAGWVAMRLRQTDRLPYLIRVSGPDIPGFERRYAALYPLLTPVLRSVWRRATFVVAKCRGEVEMIRAVDPALAVSIIPNGVDLDAFRPGIGKPYKGTLRVACVGRLIERKGQRDLIQVVKRLADDGVPLSVDLVGTGDAEPEYRDLVRRLGLESCVHFAGYVPREAIPARYAAVDVFVLPSFNEGMSVSTLEAMAAGLPLVITRTGGTEELVDEGINGFTFERGDQDALASHLRVLARDRLLVARAGAASRRRAESFGWDAAANRYRELFDRILVS